MLYKVLRGSHQPAPPFMSAWGHEKPPFRRRKQRFASLLLCRITGVDDLGIFLAFLAVQFRRGKHVEYPTCIQVLYVVDSLCWFNIFNTIEKY